MGKENLEKIAEDLKKIPGKIKGEAFHIHTSYIRSKEGENGLKKIKDKLKELNVPIEIDKVKPFEWVDMWINSLLIVVIKDVFNWSEKEIFQMGVDGAKFSFVNSLFINHFISIATLLKGSSKHWDKFFDFGEIEVTEINTKEKRAKIKIQGFGFHPMQCVYLAGYFKGLASYVVKKLSVEETKCSHRGDLYHEFSFEWE